MKNGAENILVCVAWPYVNGEPHLGHIAGTEAGFSASFNDVIPFNFGDGTTYSYRVLEILIIFICD